MKRLIVSLGMACGVALVAGCGGAGGPVATSSAVSAEGVTKSETPALRTLSADYETYSSLADLARASQLIVRGKVVTGPIKADEASQVGGQRENDVPSVVYEVDIDKVYKGKEVSKIYVIQADQGRIELSQKQTPLNAGRSVLLFLNDPGLMFRGLPVHATYGNDQGQVSLTGSPKNPKPVGQHESVPLPSTLAEIEREIAAVG